MNPLLEYLASGKAYQYHDELKTLPFYFGTIAVITGAGIGLACIKKAIWIIIRPQLLAAWAILHIPLNEAELKLFCQDIERLFRINPMLNFRKWQQIGPNRYYFTGQNISQQPPFDLN